MVEEVQNHIGGLNWGYRVALREKQVRDLHTKLGLFCSWERSSNVIFSAEGEAIQAALADKTEGQQQQETKQRGGSTSGPAMVKWFVHDEFEQSSTRVGKTKKWTSKCKHCTTVLKNKDKRGLMAHLRSKHPHVHSKVEVLDAKNQEKKKDDEQDKQLTKEDILTEKFLRFLLATGNRLDLGENYEFKELMKEINPTIILPCGATVKRFAKRRFERMKKDMTAVLARSDRLSTTSDLWSSFNCMMAFLGITVTCGEERTSQPSEVSFP